MEDLAHRHAVGLRGGEAGVELGLASAADRRAPRRSSPGWRRRASRPRSMRRGRSTRVDAYATDAERRASREASRARRASARAAAASAPSVSAGRPFFIVIGAAHASSAPAAKSASMQRAERARRSTSSMLASSTTCDRAAEASTRRRRGAEHDAEQVRAIGEIARARAPADALGRHRRPARRTASRARRRSRRRSASRARTSMPAVVGRQAAQALDRRRAAEAAGCRAAPSRGRAPSGAARRRPRRRGSRAPRRCRRCRRSRRSRRPRGSARRRSACDGPCASASASRRNVAMRARATPVGSFGLVEHLADLAVGALGLLAVDVHVERRRDDPAPLARPEVHVEARRAAAVATASLDHAPRARRDRRAPR